MDFSLSVIIPNYNNQMFIEKCIQSVIDQTYDGLREIIVVDDCSTDDSRREIQLIAERNPIVVPLFLQKNGRVSAARNQGLRIAKSGYVTFLDADDFYCNNDKLKNEMLLIQKYAAKNRNIISYSEMLFVTHEGTAKSNDKCRKKIVLEGNIYHALLVGYGMGSIMRDYCVSKELLTRVGGYNESCSFFEDYELILKLARTTMFFSVRQLGTAYRDSLNGLSKKPYSEQLSAVDRIAYTEMKNLSGFKKTCYFWERKLYMCSRNCIKKMIQLFK